MPQVGHLEKAFHIFGYFKAHLKRKLGFDLSHHSMNKNRFQKCEWTGFYRDDEEAIPWNMPVARGNFMSTILFFDGNHADDTETR